MRFLAISYLEFFSFGYFKVNSFTFIDLGLFCVGFELISLLFLPPSSSRPLSSALQLPDLALLLAVCVLQEHAPVAALGLLQLGLVLLVLHRHVDHVEVVVDRRLAGQVPALRTGNMGGAELQGVQCFEEFLQVVPPACAE